MDALRGAVHDEPVGRPRLDGGPPDRRHDVLLLPGQRAVRQRRRLRADKLFYRRLGIHRSTR